MSGCCWLRPVWSPGCEGLDVFNGRKGVEFRRRWGITAYVGPNGGGKTLHAVTDTLPTLDSGRPVLSTVRLLDYQNLRPCDDPLCESPGHPDHMAAHPCWVPFRGWSDLMDARGCDVIMDEVTGVASSRESMGLPAPVANILVQLRRRDVVLRWTAPSWSRADRIIRECTQSVVICTGHMSRAAAGRTWRTNRLFRARTLDARELDEALTQTARSVKAMNNSWTKLGALPGRDAYDTLDQVMALPVVEGGRCAACGGRRRVPACSCDSHDVTVGAGSPEGCANGHEGGSQDRSDTLTESVAASPGLRYVSA